MTPTPGPPDSGQVPAANLAPEEALAAAPQAAESEPAGTGTAEPPALVPPLQTTRRLVGASFDLLSATSNDLRRASFYIGIVVLGTVGPLALASWTIEVVAIHMTPRQMQALLRPEGTVWLGLLGSLAGSGLLVAAVESRALAAAILGGRLAGRAVTLAASLARSRMVFWRVVLGSIMVGVPLLAVQAALNALALSALGPQTDVSVATSTLAAAVIGAPLAYILSGIVLGDVDPFEAVRRSVRVFRARKAAAALVAVFETIATLLVLVGLEVGLDLAQRVFGALGLSPDSGPAGLGIMTIAILAGVFALGTLIFTAYAIAVAPQIVMFVGLTRATFGLDHVGSDGERGPFDGPVSGPRFCWLTRPMLLGFVAGGIGLVAVMVSLAH